jgi:hypothetical protein
VMARAFACDNQSTLHALNPFILLRAALTIC